MDSKSLDLLYDRGYYHGETSGYPKEGYRLHHPEWPPWLDLVDRLKPPREEKRCLLDLGCAYGYLVAEAQRRGFRACGVDISSYALSREPEFSPYLVRGELSRLPFADAVADVVCLFDVLEHLHHPLQALRQAVRVLAPEGLLLASTPDPLYFDRQESTHLYERPPTFWIDHLRNLGLQVNYRFSVEAFNFQLVAAFAGSKLADELAIFQHDYFSPLPDFVEAPRPLRVTPRFGWSALQEGARRMSAGCSALYLENENRQPVEVVGALDIQTSGDFGQLQVRANSLVLARVEITSETTCQTIQLPSFQLPAGGHHLFFELRPPEGVDLAVSRIRLHSETIAACKLTESLPFDLYQRYRLAASVAEQLQPESVLDVGGFLGDQDGHLATVGDFFSTEKGTGPRVQTTDLRQGDFPEHQPCSAWEQPFPDGHFDLVLSLDVLEHLPPSRRRQYLQELDRVASRWVLVGAPFASEEVENAEAGLAATLMGSQTFLQEHQQLGLPETELMVEFFEGERGYQLLSLPNGYLPRWSAVQSLTQLYFGLGLVDLIQDFNRLYNCLGYPHDNAAPAYRLLWIACKNPLAPEQQSAIRGLLSDDRQHGSLEEILMNDQRFLSLQQRVLQLVQEKARQLHDAHFLINERQKLIALQSSEISALRRELEETPLWRLARRRWNQSR